MTSGEGRPGAVGGGVEDAAIEGLTARGLQRLEVSFKSEIDRGNTSGAVISIVRDGRPIYFEALGFQDRERGLAMRRDSVFRIASMTKPLIATAALMLMEEGLLALIDPIDRYLPEFKNMQVGTEYVDPSDGARRLSLEAAHRPITVLDLLRHTSGLTTALFGDSLVRQMYHDSRIRDDQQTNGELASKLARMPLMHQPGTTFEYGMSTDVLGRIIEVLSERDLNRFLVERIAEPLGMEDTAFLLNERNQNRFALPQNDGAASILSSYDRSRPPRWFSGGSGALSTAGDFTRFCQMLLHGGAYDGRRLLSRKSVELLRSDQLPPNVALGPNTRDLGIAAPLPEFGQSYGLGVGVRIRPGLSPVPGSVGDFFWAGALGTYFWIDPQERLIAILMMQELDLQKRARYRSLLRNLVYHAFED
jgi:CubicO group peptidase (beta-lactamase class C family)